MLKRSETASQLVPFAAQGLQIVPAVLDGRGADNFAEQGIEIVGVVIAHQRGNMGGGIIGGNQQGLGKADAPADGVLDGGIAGGILEGMGEIGNAAVQCSGNFLQTDGFVSGL